MSNTTLQNLDLSGEHERRKKNPFHAFTSKPTVNEIGDKGATSLSRALVINRTLTVLNLASQLQKKALRQMKCIHSSVFCQLTSTGNNIGETGIRSLCDTLMVNSTLTVLNLKGNHKERKVS